MTIDQRTPMKPPPRRTASIRLSERERHLLEVAAMNRQISLAEFLRVAATETARRELGSAPVKTTVGGAPHE